MKILRLVPADARTWRENRSVLVDAEGNKVRLIELVETRVLSDLQKKCRHTRQPLQVDVDQILDGKKVTTRIAISFKEVAPRQPPVIVSKVDGHEVVDGREFFKREVFKAHGECQLRDHTGRFMCAVRDPHAKRPTAKDAQRHAPRPDHCQCRTWGEPHPGRHHIVCEWNTKAPIEEQAVPTGATAATLVDQKLLPGTRPVEKPSILQTKVRKNAAESGVQPTASPNMPAPAVRQLAIAPEACLCKSFAMPDGSVKPEGVHHPICQNREAWELQAMPKRFLVHVDTGQVMRQATKEEIDAASGEHPYITIGDDQYAVLLETEVMPEGAKKVVPEKTETESEPVAQSA